MRAHRHPLDLHTWRRSPGTRVSSSCTTYGHTHSSVLFVLGGVEGLLSSVHQQLQPQTQPHAPHPWEQQQHATAVSASFSHTTDCTGCSVLQTAHSPRRQQRANPNTPTNPSLARHAHSFIGNMWMRPLPVCTGIHSAHTYINPNTTCVDGFMCKPLPPPAPAVATLPAGHTTFLNTWGAAIIPSAYTWAACATGQQACGCSFVCCSTALIVVFCGNNKPTAARVNSDRDSAAKTRTAARIDKKQAEQAYATARTNKTR